MGVVNYYRPTGACNESLATRPLLSHPLLLQLCMHIFMPTGRPLILEF